MRRIILGSITGILVSSAAFADDLNKLLQTGSCYHCQINGADLRGRSLAIDTIQDSTITNFDFSASNISIKSIVRSSISQGNWSGASISIGEVASSEVSFMNFASSSINVWRFNGTLRDSNLANATANFVTLNHALFSKLGLTSAHIHSNWCQDTSFVSLGGQSLSLDIAAGARYTIQSSKFTSSVVSLTGNDSSLERVTLGYSSDINLSTETQFRVLNSSLQSNNIETFGNVWIDSLTDLTGSRLNNRHCSGRSTATCY